MRSLRARFFFSYRKPEEARRPGAKVPRPPLQIQTQSLLMSGAAGRDDSELSPGKSTRRGEIDASGGPLVL